MIFRKTTQRKSEEIKRLSKAFALSVAYAANTGGIATLVGTPPNLVLQSVANTYVYLYFIFIQIVTNVYLYQLPNKMLHHNTLSACIKCNWGGVPLFQ